MKPEELRLVWDSYLAFERSRMNTLRMLDVQRRRQACVSCNRVPSCSACSLTVRQVGDSDSSVTDVTFLQRAEL